MTHNCLKLNQNKTEWLIFNGGAIPRNVTLTVGEHNIKQSAHIRSLGIKLDPEITIEPQIEDVFQSAYYHLRRINTIRRLINRRFHGNTRAFSCNRPLGLLQYPILWVNIQGYPQATISP